MQILSDYPEKFGRHIFFCKKGFLHDWLVYTNAKLHESTGNFFVKMHKFLKQLFVFLFPYS